MTPYARTFIVGAVGVFLSGCASHDIGYSGQHPGAIECTGKAVVTFSGTLNMGSGVTGTGSDNGTITFDCGSGASIKQGPPVTDSNVSGQNGSPVVPSVVAPQPVVKIP
jgi:hypothetical protein